MMKKMLIALCLIGVYSALHANGNEILAVLLPERAGELGVIKEGGIAQSGESHFDPRTDGMVCQFGYSDGIVVTGLSTSHQKFNGIQTIYLHGKELSTSKDYSIDPNDPDTVVHVHKKYLVYTSRDKQRVVPR